MVFDKLNKKSTKNKFDIYIKKNYIIKLSDKEEVLIEHVIDYWIKNSVFNDNEDSEDGLVSVIPTSINKEINQFCSYKRWSIRSVKW